MNMIMVGKKNVGKQKRKQQGREERNCPSIDAKD